MEELFRMLLVRPPKQTERQHTIQLEQPSSLQNELTERESSAEPGILESLLRRYLSSELMIKNLSQLHYSDVLKDTFFTLCNANNLDHISIKNTLELNLGHNWKNKTEQNEWITDISLLKDSILTLKLLNEEMFEAPLEDLVKCLRTMNFVEKFKSHPNLFKEMKKSLDILQAVIILPSWSVQMTKYQNRKKITINANEKSDDQSELERKEQTLAKAYEELLAVPSQMVHIESTPSLTDSETSEFETTTDVRPMKSVVTKVLKGEVVAKLSDLTSDLLSELNIDLTAIPFENALQQLRDKLRNFNEQLRVIRSKSNPRNVALIGSRAFPINSWDDSGRILPNFNSEIVPITHGNLRPVGVGDLLIVKQQLVSYEAGDIAHVENILQGESKSREHRRRKMTEQFTLEEKEVTKEEEFDLQSTQRYEMTKEVQGTLHEQTKLEAGIKVTARYGVVVEVEANAKYATENAHDISRKDSTHLSKEVTDKTVRKLSEKIRTQQTLRIVEEVEETNKHGFENTGSNGHVIGIYQWLNKIYEAQVFNYGLRTMYDLVLQEPATLYIDALKIKATNQNDLVKPIEFNLDPLSINELNYSNYVEEYGAEGVKAPPEPFVTVSKVFKGGPLKDPDEGPMTEGIELPIPEGYTAFSGSAVVSYVNWVIPEKPSSIDVILGAQFHRFNNFVNWEGQLDDESRTIPVTVKTYNIKGYVLAIEIMCRRTNTFLTQWKLDTHNAIQQAYKLRMSEYEQKLAKLLESRNGIKGHNPEYNKKLIQDELKRMAVSLITQQTYDFVNPIEVDSNGFPHPRLNISGEQGEYIRFFEQAFEWENLTYVFYPYFWSRKETWLERFDYADADPLFTQFIKAGAARVVVPARPGFESAIDHFMKTGKIWNGKGLPDITDPLYVPIVQEIKNQLGAPLNEKPWGSSWKVKLPTDLVRLRPDESLPVWKKNKSGEWVPNDTLRTVDERE
ncbi:hypothetical protein ACFX4I_01155 [Peribacillus sp. YIM B13472]|uniref:hypothetical protein n=1 Tax=Peribacillus sp. YIM B13472 TaxID=3366297 RepID=UPI003671EED8